MELEDAAPFLNEQVNQAIREVVEDWSRSRRFDPYVVTGIYRRIGGVHWVDRLERLAME